MQQLLDRIGRLAATAVAPLLGVGVGVTVLGAALQVAQGTGHIGPVPALGTATIFGVLSKVGGAAMLAGLVCGALQVRDNSGVTIDGSSAEPLGEPLSARGRPADATVRPHRVARDPSKSAVRPQGPASAG